MDGPTREEFEAAAREARALEVRLQAHLTLDQRLAAYLAHCDDVARWTEASGCARSPRLDLERNARAQRLERWCHGPETPLR